MKANTIEELQDKASLEFSKHFKIIAKNTLPCGPITAQCRYCGQIERNFRVTHIYPSRKRSFYCRNPKCQNARVSKQLENIPEISQKRFDVTKHNHGFNLSCKSCGQHFKRKVIRPKPISCINKTCANYFKKGHYRHN